MKTQHPPDLDPYKFFSDRINSKEDKILLLPYLESNRGRIIEYSSHFCNKSIELLGVSNLSKKEQSDLESLYNFNCLSMNDLKNNLLKVNGGHEIAICPYCEKDTPNSFDHFLPKKAFPEFAVHPLNLILSCSTCNSRKGQRYHNQKGDKACFNVYIDKEPSEEYLSCTLEINDNILVPFYKADFNRIVDKKLAVTIRNTYTNLDLLTRYKIFAIAAIDDFYTLYRGLQDFTHIKNVISTERVRWKKVFYNAICDSLEAQQYIQLNYKI